MTIWDMRQWIETRIPIWIPVVLVLVVVFFAFVVESGIKKNKGDTDEIRKG